MAESNANVTKTRGQVLLRADDKVSGVVSFYDRREADVAKAFIGKIDVNAMLPAGVVIPPHVIKAACHGYTQNMLDSSNKLEGNERVAYVRKTCAIVQAGGWASAPMDEAAIRENAIAGLVKLNIPRAQAEAIVAKNMPKQ